VSLRTFVTRPVLSGVIAALIFLAGLTSIPTLPIAQYPQIAPPTVTVTSTYIGADAATVESAVTNPLEEQINGVPGLQYMSSTSSNAGVSTITCTFDPARDVDLAAVDVQNRVQNAQGSLPAAVTQTGVQIAKSSGSFIMAIAFTSKDAATSALDLSNFLDRNVKDPLLRVDGVSAATIFGERRYAMRVWLDNPPNAAVRSRRERRYDRGREPERRGCGRLARSGARAREPAPDAQRPRSGTAGRCRRVRKYHRQARSRRFARASIAGSAGRTRRTRLRHVVALRRQAGTRHRHYSQ
jgi:hypothetical protein